MPRPRLLLALVLTWSCGSPDDKASHTGGDSDADTDTDTDTDTDAGLVTTWLETGGSASASSAGEALSVTATCADGAPFLGGGFEATGLDITTNDSPDRAEWLVGGVATDASASLAVSLVCTNASWTVHPAEGPPSRDGMVGQKMVSAVVCPSGMVVGGGCTGSGIALTESVPTVYEGTSSAWACAGRVLDASAQLQAHAYCAEEMLDAYVAFASASAPIGPADGVVTVESSCQPGELSLGGGFSGDVEVRVHRSELVEGQGWQADFEALVDGRSANVGALCLRP